MKNKGTNEMDNEYCNLQKQNFEENMMFETDIQCKIISQHVLNKSM